LVVARWDPDRDTSSRLYTGAATLWELSLLQHHYHPSVRHFTSGLLNDGKNTAASTAAAAGGKKGGSAKPPPPHAIVYKGDPLGDFTVKHFLDRFAYARRAARCL